MVSPNLLLSQRRILHKASVTFLNVLIVPLSNVNNMDAFANVPNNQKAEFLRHLEDTQIKDSLRFSFKSCDIYPASSIGALLTDMQTNKLSFLNFIRLYNNLVESCFDKCVASGSGGVSLYM